MTYLTKTLLFLLAAALPTLAASFLPLTPPQRPLSSTSVYFFKGKNYDTVVENLMMQRGLTREEAEKEYDAYRANPNNYALAKGEAYYKSLGYNSLMEGVIGEAEKEGRGDEVKERIAAFKRKSQIKALSVISVAITSFFYWKITGTPI